MERTVKLSLRQENGKYKDHIIDFVSYSKRQEYIRMEAELEKKEKKPIEADYENLQVNFVAGLFGIEPKEILDGLDSADRSKIWEIVRYRVLGFSKEEDEQVKKALREEALVGLTTTTSNSDSSEN